MRIGDAAVHLIGGALVLTAWSLCPAGEDGVVTVTPVVPGALTFAEDEIAHLWESRVATDPTHRGYIFIDERDIELDAEMPEFVVTAWQYGFLKQLDATMSPRRKREIEIIGSLQPDLARDLDYRMRTEQTFFKPSPGVMLSLGPSLYDATLGRGE